MIAFKDISGDLSECFHSMAMDHLSLIVRNDNYISQVGQNILHVSKSTRKATEKMRSIAKVFQHARDLDRKKSNSKRPYLVHPLKFDVVVKCTKKVSGYDEQTWLR